MDSICFSAITYHTWCDRWTGSPSCICVFLQTIFFTASFNTCGPWPGVVSGQGGVFFSRIAPSVSQLLMADSIHMPSNSFYLAPVQVREGCVTAVEAPLKQCSEVSLH